MLDKRANTPEEKRQVLDELYELWITVPELRLGQLLKNVLIRRSIYYIEDFDLVTEVRTWVETRRK